MEVDVLTIARAKHLAFVPLPSYGGHARPKTPGYGDESRLRCLAFAALPPRVPECGDESHPRCLTIAPVPPRTHSRGEHARRRSRCPCGDRIHRDSRRYQFRHCQVSLAVLLQGC